VGIKYLAAAWKANTSPTEKLVLLALADHANDKTGLCFPSIDTLATKTGFSGRTISKAITALEGQGLLQRNEVRGRVSHYDLYLFDGYSTPESDSGVACEFQRRTAPLNDAHHPANKMHPTPALNSAHPRTTFTRTIKEPKNNRNKTAAPNPAAVQTPRRSPLPSRLDGGRASADGSSIPIAVEEEADGDDMISSEMMAALIEQVKHSLRP